MPLPPSVVLFTSDEGVASSPSAAAVPLSLTVAVGLSLAPIVPPLRPGRSAPDSLSCSEAVLPLLLVPAVAILVAGSAFDVFEPAAVALPEPFFVAPDGDDGNDDFCAELLFFLAAESVVVLTSFFFASFFFPALELLAGENVSSLPLSSKVKSKSSSSSLPTWMAPAEALTPGEEIRGRPVRLGEDVLVDTAAPVLERFLDAVFALGVVARTHVCGESVGEVGMRSREGGCKNVGLATSDGFERMLLYYCKIFLYTMDK